MPLDQITYRFHSPALLVFFHRLAPSPSSCTYSLPYICPLCLIFSFPCPSLVLLLLFHLLTPWFCCFSFISLHPVLLVFFHFFLSASSSELTQTNHIIFICLLVLLLLNFFLLSDSASLLVLLTKSVCERKQKPKYRNEL